MISKIKIAIIYYNVEALDEVLFIIFLNSGRFHNGFHAGSKRSNLTDSRDGIDNKYLICSIAASYSPTIT
jgi:hypothetical protein